MVILEWKSVVVIIMIVVIVIIMIVVIVIIEDIIGVEEFLVTYVVNGVSIILGLAFYIKFLQVIVFGLHYIRLVIIFSVHHWCIYILIYVSK